MEFILDSPVDAKEAEVWGDYHVSIRIQMGSRESFIIDVVVTLLVFKNLLLKAVILPGNVKLDAVCTGRSLQGEGLRLSWVSCIPHKYFVELDRPVRPCVALPVLPPLLPLLPGLRGHQKLLQNDGV